MPQPIHCTEWATPALSFKKVMSHCTLFPVMWHLVSSTGGKSLAYYRELEAGIFHFMTLITLNLIQNQYNLTGIYMSHTQISTQKQILNIA